MKIIIKLIVHLLFLSVITQTFSCTNKNVIDIKSPCVSLESGPCGQKRPINDWWLKTNA